MDTVQLNNLIEGQEKLGLQLKTILTNIKKDSPSRKTAKYITDRKAGLRDVIRALQENHDLLKDDKRLRDHTYITADYFSSVMDLYNEAIYLLSQSELKLKEESKLAPENPALPAEEGSTSNQKTVTKINEPVQEAGTSQANPNLGMQKFRVSQLERKLIAAKQSLIEDNSSWMLRSILEGIQKQWDVIEVSHMQLLVEGTCISDRYFTEMKFEELQEDYEAMSCHLLTKINEATESHKESKHGVRLPKLTIPIFSGEYESWYSFRDLFRNMIHKEPTLTSTEKMQYLKTHVRGEPSRMIQHLCVSESNYIAAWELLTKRYDNERLIISKFLDKMLDLPKIERPESVKLKNMFDLVNESIAGLKNQGVDTKTWDPILIRIIVRKWDSETNNIYELSLNEPSKQQTFDSLMEFMSKRFKCLESANNATNVTKVYPQNRTNFYKPGTSQGWVAIQGCWYCNKKDHNIYQCMHFKALPVRDRISAVSYKKICVNCISHYTAEKCKSAAVCNGCGKYHHSMLHIHNNSYNNTYNKPTVSHTNNGRQNIKTTSSWKGKAPYRMNLHVSVMEPGSGFRKTTVLATALAETTTYHGETRLLRILCDQGSEASFCTEEVAQMLSYPREKMQIEIKGIGDEKPKTSKCSIFITLKPRFPSAFRLPVSLIVLPKLTSALPKQDVPQIGPDNLGVRMIADPTYYKKGPIDVILGAQEYSKLLLGGLEKIEDGILAQNTEFGWIFSGWRLCNQSNQLKIMSMSACTEEVKQLTKFWELEEIQEKLELKEEDVICEDYYKRTTERNGDGSYTVRIPFKNRELMCKESRHKAAARLFQLEKMFEKNKSLQKQYIEFMTEYEEMGHMKKVKKSEYGKGSWYIPHHGVVREDRLTTKLRVVYDASSKSKGQVSLNENMYKGLRLQQDLTTILMRWRKHKVAWMADIEKMYRFIKVNKGDLKFQRILWRKSPNDPIDEYELTTVTYGTSAAPYLAVRTLQQLALDEQENYPLASKITLQDFFVDDLLSGAQSVKEAKGLQNELIAMLKSGGFNLRKWSSNKEEILDNIPEELREDMIKLPQHETRKSLGVMWSPLQDTFQFKVNVTSMDSPTKRFILSEISKIFDPMGWLAPVIVKMKMLIQELWTNGSEWDKPVDSSTKKKWVDFQQQIGSVESIRIPRWTQYTGTEVELHGFADASELAYGAVIYSRVKINGRYYVTLLQAKSKVAPKKGKTTLPRLELCAANLLAKLMEKVKSGLDCEHVTSYCWTDSMITLGWIKGESGKWQTFVANRVTEIQKLVGSENWNHVKSADNAADVLSRGIEPCKLESHSLWWNGPSWLQDEKLPVSKTLPEICQEIEMSHHVIVDEELNREEIWERFSKLQRMIRVLSYCFRLIRGNRGKSELVDSGEMGQTMWRIIRVIQKQSMPEEYEALQKKKCVKKSSKMSSLDPFIGEDNIIRVGGRLEHSQLPYDQKHPIILPYKHHVSVLIVRDAHERTLHGGNKLTLAYIRQKYWIIGVKKMIKKHINKCVTCIRYKASTPHQKMGQLPAPRVNPSQTFTHTGVDYAGPIQVRTTKGRGNKSTKGYIAVFVCLATKAIHLELVGDLTTESFIAALTRFKSRRGHVAHLYSDNGKTFVGAAMLLYTELLQITQSPQFQSAVANMGTQWHFIPPLSPSMGGIWEAGVKSMKHHIKRVIGDSTLTYEELTTLLSQVEACLNSRPLCAQSEDIEDGVILTPSHFLIGRESVGIPDPIVETSMDLQGRWKLIQKMKKDLWKSWTRDYLQELQQRHKWKFDQENLQIGTVVIIKDENITPSKWPLARIKETHLGSDGKNRVVTLQKASGTCLKRSLHSIIPISSQQHDTKPLNRCERTLRHQQADNAKNKVTLDDIVSGVSSNMTRIVRAGHNVNRRQRNTSTSGFINRMLWFTIMIGLFNTVDANYTIKNIEEGIYVEQIGTATINRGVFRIQANFDKEIIKTDIFHVRGVVSQFKQFCEKTKRSDDDIHCTQLYQHLYEEQLKLEKTEESIMHPGYVREKRGLFGQLLTSVFGVNDEVYKDIDTLHTNQNKLIEAANHQTKFMISTVAAVNETEERIAKKLGRVQTNLNQAIDYINKANVWYKKVDQNWLHIHVLNMYQLAVNYITEIEEHYTGLLQVSMHQGTIYNVLKIKEIQQIISNANTKLPAKLKIVPNQLIQTKSAENVNHIQVYGYFVIQDVSEYTLMHVTPVPKIDKRGRLYSIEIYHSITGIDYNNENYFELSKEEFRSCIRKGNEYICYPMSVKNMQANRNCVNDLLFKKTEEIECNTRLLNITSTVWKQLYMANTWMVITTKPVKASIICDGEREEVTMQATSVVHISENCIIKTRNNMLAARRMSTVQVLATYTKKANFSLNTNISTSLIKDMARDEEVLDSSRDLFRHLANKESALQTELDRTIWQRIQTHSLTVVLQYMFRDTIALETDKCRTSLYDGKTVKWKIKNSIPHDLGDPEGMPFSNINAYNIHDVSQWRDLNIKFVLQVARDHRLLRAHSAPFNKDRYQSMAYIDDVRSGTEDDLYSRATGQTAGAGAGAAGARAGAGGGDSPARGAPPAPPRPRDILDLLYRSVEEPEELEENVEAEEVGVGVWDARQYVTDMYPACAALVRKALAEWDADGDGLIENGGFPDQTYDAWVMSGPSAYCGGLWLAAIAGVLNMARTLSLEGDATEFSNLLERAKAAFEEKLWHGSHYRFDTQPANNHVVMSDQLAGLWFLRASGSTEKVFPESHVKKALQSIYENNVLKFVNGKMGAVNGWALDRARVDNTALQSGEVWVGVVYGLAATMIYEGMHEEAFKTAGGLHNTLTQLGLSFETPEALYENGNHRSIAYMRPLAIWGMYQAILARPPAHIPIANGQVSKENHVNGL